MKCQSVIGRSRTGDQLHRCHYVEHDGRAGYISDNASCNNHMHLRPLSVSDRQRANGEKATVRMRPGLFCVKCFGADADRIIAHDYYNATVTA